jgi:hypothetical protein
MIPRSRLPANDNAKAGVLASLELPPRRAPGVWAGSPISQGAQALVGGLVGGFAGEGATPLIVARCLLLILNPYKATL